MASTSSRIRIIFDGVADGVTRAAASAERAIDRLNARLEANRASIDRVNKAGDKLGKGLAIVAKGFLVAGAGAASLQSAVGILATVATVTAELAPAALAIPGIILAAAAAYGVFKLATSGVGDALKGDAKAFAQLAPEAQKFVTAIRSLNPEFQKLRKEVQNSFFKGLNVEIKQTGKELLSLGREFLPPIASGFNAIGKQAIVAARNPFFKDDLRAILSNTALGLKNMEGSAGKALLALGGIGAVGSKYFPRLTAAIDRATTRLVEWVDTGRDTGELERMIDRSIEAWKTLGRILADVGAGARDLFRAFSEGLGGGSGTLASIERFTQAFRELAASSGVQAAMRALGETVRVVGDAFRLVLTAAIEELGPVLTAVAPFVQELARVIGDMLAGAIRFAGPLLREFATFLSENKEAIAPFAAVLVTLVAALKVFAGAVALVRGPLRLLGPALRGVGTALRFLGTRAGLMGLAVVAGIDVAIGAIKGFTAEQDAAFAKGNFFDDIKIFWDEFKREPFQAIGKEFRASLTPPPTAEADFKRIGDSFQRDFVDVITNGVTKIDESFQRDFIDVFANLPTTVGPTLESIGTQISDFFTVTIPEKLTSFGTTLDTKAREAWESFKTASAAKLEEIKTQISDFFSYETGVAIGEWAGRLVTQATEAWQGWLDEQDAKLAEVGTQISDFFTVTIPEKFTAFTETLKTKATEAWQAFQDETTRKVDEIVTYVTELPGKIETALTELPEKLKTKAKDAWDEFFGETSSGSDRSVAEAGKVPGETDTATDGIIDILLEKARTAWQGWLDEQVKKGQDIIADARALPGKASDAIGNLGRTLWAQGEAFMDGLLGGIRAAYERVRVFVAGIADGLAREKGPLPYDRKVMVAPGEALMQGLLAGITTGYDRIRAFVSTMAPELAGQVSSGVSIANARIAAFDATQAARAQAASAARTQLGDTLTSVSATATREPAAPVVNVLLSREKFAELARIEIEDRDRQTARRVGAGAGQSF